jgi:hypothetical protein
MGQSGELDFDFDALARLAREDPNRFEATRAALVRQLIGQAPEHIKPRLEGLQWQVDCLRQQSKTPLAACVKISNLMWNQVLGRGGLAESLHQVAEAGRLNRDDDSGATILQFGGKGTGDGE